MVLITMILHFFSSVLKLGIFATFFIQNIGLKLHNQAPKQANFYESQWIALNTYSSISWNNHTVLIPHSELGRIYAKMQFMPCWMFFSWPRGKNHTKFANRHTLFNRRYVSLLKCLLVNHATIAQVIERQPFLPSLKQAPCFKNFRGFESHDSHNRLFCFISQCGVVEFSNGGCKIRKIFA